MGGIMNVTKLLDQKPCESCKVRNCHASHAFEYGRSWKVLLTPLLYSAVVLAVYGGMAWAVRVDSPSKWWLFAAVLPAGAAVVSSVFVGGDVYAALAWRTHRSLLLSRNDSYSAALRLVAVLCFIVGIALATTGTKATWRVTNLAIGLAAAVGAVAVALLKGSSEVLDRAVRSALIPSELLTSSVSLGRSAAGRLDAAERKSSGLPDAAISGEDLRGLVSAVALRVITLFFPAPSGCYEEKIKAIVGELSNQDFRSKGDENEKLKDLLQQLLELCHRSLESMPSRNRQILEMIVHPDKLAHLSYLQLLLTQIRGQNVPPRRMQLLHRRYGFWGMTSEYVLVHDITDLVFDPITKNSSVVRKSLKKRGSVHVTYSGALISIDIEEERQVNI
jgi:hypothetical protein